MYAVQVQWEGHWVDGYRVRKGAKNSRVRFHFDNQQLEDLFPNGDIREAPHHVANVNAAARIIPITPLRALYQTLRDLRGGAATQFNALCDIINPTQDLDATTFLAELFSRSITQFNSYHNEEPFVRDVGQREQDPRRVGFARRVVDLCADKKELFSGYQYVTYELSTYRTTRSCFEDGQPADRSGQGGIDLLLCSPSRLPTVGEIKASTETVGPTFALIQALMYAAELASPKQLLRLKNHYKDHFGGGPEKVEICLILEVSSVTTTDDLEHAKSLAQALMNDDKVNGRIGAITLIGGQLNECGEINFSTLI